jgi:P-type Ca2+ transporter type 2C
MIDPPRDEVKSAIDECHEAGINVVKITGYEGTAVAVGKQIGITGPSIIEKDLEKISDEDFENTVQDIAI